MGFWGKFGKAALAAAPFAAMAIPGVGPVLGGALKAGGIGSKVLSGVGSAAGILGGVAKGRAQGREAEIKANQEQDRVRAELARLGADRAKFELESPRTRAEQAAFGEMLANERAGPALRSTRGLSTAGPAPDAGFLFGANARGTGQGLSDLAYTKMGHDTFEVPTATAMPQANALDKILSYAAPAAAGLDLWNRRRSPQYGGQNESSEGY